VADTTLAAMAVDWMSEGCAGGEAAADDDEPKDGGL
jgi:hypothetical protein